MNLFHSCFIYVGTVTCEILLAIVMLVTLKVLWSMNKYSPNIDKGHTPYKLDKKNWQKETPVSNFSDIYRVSKKNATFLNLNISKNFFSFLWLSEAKILSFKVQVWFSGFWSIYQNLEIILFHNHIIFIEFFTLLL